MIGGIALTLALLRALQEETGSALTGNLSWAPYALTLLALSVVIGLLAPPHQQEDALMTEENPPITRDDIEQGMRDLSGEITGQAQAAAPKLSPVGDRSWLGAALHRLPPRQAGRHHEVERRGDPANLMAGSRSFGPAYVKRTFRLNATRKGLLGGIASGWPCSGSCSSPNGRGR